MHGIVADIVFRAIGLVACCAFAFLGRWIYSHPKLFLEKFLGKGITHGRPAFIWAKLVGALWLFVAVGGILSGVFGWLPERIASSGPFIAIYVALAALISWQLLKARTARL
jgi:hypothetical protein